ncbi:endonuclease/exonuclease/phosphatase family protein [Streptomyces sp. NPDC037389]|uniref:endonuclease/exonuclease/phosphatase family protein n=1 Tax=Streptomyces sp. NPDC037389 TaxID=3155369 RepID=UPI0033F848AB
MNHLDPAQGLLFGSGPGAVTDDLAHRELRLIAANVEGAPTARTQRLLSWLYESGANVLVLSEVRFGPGAHRLVSDLEASGYTVRLRDRDPDDAYAYAVVVATKGYTNAPVALSFSTPRMTAVRLETHLGPIDLIGLYSLTNGMTAESSQRRRAFQEQVLTALHDHLKANPDVPIAIAGDFNVLEPGHQPPCDLFAQHDYTFYSELLALGLTDAYRHLNPDGAEATWHGPQGGQRLDHTLLSTNLAPSVRACRLEHTIRSQKISDHSAITTVLQ